MKITMTAVAVTGLTSGALLLAPAGMAFADSPGGAQPQIGGSEIQDLAGTVRAALTRSGAPGGSGAPGAPGVSIPTSVADSSSVSNNRLGPWLGLIGNSLNGSLNNSLNGATVSALNDGARVSALNGVLSPPFTVLSGNTIIVRVTTINSDNSSRVTQSETTTITTNRGAPGQQG